MQLISANFWLTTLKLVLERHQWSHACRWSKCEATLDSTNFVKILCIYNFVLNIWWGWSKWNLVELHIILNFRGLFFSPEYLARRVALNGDSKASSFSSKSTSCTSIQQMTAIYIVNYKLCISCKNSLQKTIINTCKRISYDLKINRAHIPGVQLTDTSEEQR